MSDFLKALREDLLSRRVLPLLVIVSALFLAAVGYAALGGGGSSPGASGSVGSEEAGGALRVSAAGENADEAIAETADGTSFQHASGMRDPFASVPGVVSAAGGTSAGSPSPASASAAGSSASSSSASGSSGSSGSGSSAAGSSETGSSESGSSESEASEGSGGTPAQEVPAKVPPKKPSPPVLPPNTIYSIALRFEEESAQTTGPQGALTGPAGTVTGSEGAQTPGAVGGSQNGPVRTAVPRGLELPSGSEPRLVFAGILAGGEYGIFEVTGEVFPGSGKYCVPSAIQCQAIKLPVGAKLRLQYEGDGKTVDAVLEISQIGIRAATTEAAKEAHEQQARAGIMLIGGPNATLPGGLRYSVEQGVLVPVKG